MEFPNHSRFSEAGRILSLYVSVYTIRIVSSLARSRGTFIPQVIIPENRLFPTPTFFQSVFIRLSREAQTEGWAQYFFYEHRFRINQASETLLVY